MGTPAKRFGNSRSSCFRSWRQWCAWWESSWEEQSGSISYPCWAAVSVLGDTTQGVWLASLFYSGTTKASSLVRWDQTTHLPSLLFCFSGWNIRALENKDHGKPRASFPLLAIASTHKCRDLVSPELHISSVSDGSSCGSLLALNTLMLL